ncbi:MAG: phage portal protein, partial [Bacteroidales bacterium]|nr:phage portal protein [Candidatus Scybalousia scybalohippi]
HFKCFFILGGTMGAIREWLIDTFGNEVKPSQEWSAQMKAIFEQYKELKVNNYALSVISELYGSLLSQCDFITYINGEVVEKDVWYRLNVEPNPNQSSSEFMRQLARQLVFKGEALIIKVDNGDLFVASDFQKKNYQLRETHFTNVWVDCYGDSEVPAYQLTGDWYGDKCIYIKYQNPKVQSYLHDMGNLYQDLIKNVKNAGSSAIKYVLNVDATAQNGVNIDLQKELTKILNDDFEALADSEKNAMIPLLNGFKLEVLNPSNNNAQNSAVASNNINNIFEDVLVNVGHIYNVPASFMTGKFEKNDMDEFLTFGLDPLCSLIGECTNRKYYGKKQILSKTYCVLDTKKVKHFDILTVSDAINKLISSGVYTINEIRNILGEPLIDKEIGDKHWITRNYAVVGDYIQEMTNFTGNDPKTHQNNQNNNGGQDEK